MQGVPRKPVLAELLAAYPHGDVMRHWEAIGRYRARQLTLWEYDPCRAPSPRGCWLCPINSCTRPAEPL